MKSIGITGSIASGKSTVAKLMAGKKYPLFSADQVVTNLYKNKKFIQKLIKKLESSNKQSVLILGAGGVTPSIIYALQKANISKVFVCNRTLKKAEEIKKRFSFINIISWEKIDEKIKEMDLLINATSLGTKGGEEFSNLFLGFKKNLVYYDVVYNPLQTRLMKHFIDNNIKAFNGLEMLIYQAQKAFYLWNKVNPEVDVALIKEMQGLIK